VLMAVEDGGLRLVATDSYRLAGPARGRPSPSGLANPKDAGHGGPDMG